MASKEGARQSLIQSLKQAPRILERFAREEHPEFVPYFPDEEEEQKGEKKLKPVADLLAAYRRWRGKQVELIESGGDALWRKTATSTGWRSCG